jgi:hypothetical protein
LQCPLVPSEVTLHTRQSLMGGACVCSLAFSPAAAEQPLSDSEKIERLERQTELLQKQLKALKTEIAQTKKRAVVVSRQAGDAAATPGGSPTNSPELKAPPPTRRDQGHARGHDASLSGDGYAADRRVTNLTRGAGIAMRSDVAPCVLLRMRRHRHC